MRGSDRRSLILYFKQVIVDMDMNDDKREEETTLHQISISIQPYFYEISDQ